MNSYKYVLNLKLHWVASSTYHSRLVLIGLPPTIPVQCLLFSPKIFVHHSHLTYPSTILHLFAINKRFGFIEAHQEKHTESLNEYLILLNFQILLLIAISRYSFIILNTQQPILLRNQFELNLLVVQQKPSLQHHCSFEIQTNFVSPLKDHLCL